MGIKAASDKGKSFVLYNDQYDALKGLPDEIKAQLFDGIFLHARNEQQQALDPVVAALLAMITGRIDRDKKAYVEACRARSEAGKKGGRPNKATVFQKPADEIEKAKKAR